MSMMHTILILGALVGLAAAVLIEKRRQRDEHLQWRQSLNRLLTDMPDLHVY